MLSLIIPTYAGRHYLGPCLRSVLAQSQIPDEIIVVDDGSPEPTDAAFVTDEFIDESRIKVIRNETNMGFAEAINRGFAASQGDFIALINNDTVLNDRWVERAQQPFSDERWGDRVGSVATRIVRFDSPDLLDSAGDLYTIAGGTEKYGSGCPVWTAGGARETFSACAAAAVYRREALREVDLNPAKAKGTEEGSKATEILDPSFQSYWEDVDLGFRLGLAGWKTVFTPEAICRHHVSASYDAGSWNYHFRSSRNAEVVYWSNMPGSMLLRHLPAHILFLLFQAIFKLRQGRLAAWTAGKVAFLARLPYALSRRGRILGSSRASARDLREAMTSDWFRLHWRAAKARNTKK